MHRYFKDVLNLANIWQVLACVLLAVNSWAFYHTVMYSFSWGLMHDAPLMHYAAMQILAGKVPIVDFLETNFPVAYLLHMVAIIVFGPDDWGWRLFELAMMGLISVGIFLYCRPHGWVASVLGVLVFMMLHLSHGQHNMGQRDFLLCVFLIWGMLALAWVMEGHGKGAALAAGIMMGLGVWMKPVVLVLVAMQALFLITHGKRHMLLYAALGMALVTASILGWYGWMGALVPFLLFTLNYTLPIYSKTGNWHSEIARFSHMLSCLGMPLIFLLFPGGNSDRGKLVLLAVVYGALHFFLQGKGFFYHVYPMLLFVVVMGACRLGDCIRSGEPYVAMLGLGAMLVGTLVMNSFNPPYNLVAPRRDGYRNMIINDFKTVPGGRIQVLDGPRGGIEALYVMGKPNATRFMYDFMLHQRTETPYVKQLRKEFIQEITETKPDAFFLTERGWPGSFTYDRWVVKDFPEFNAFLDAHYVVKIKRIGYRIFVRKPEEVLQK